MCRVKNLQGRLIWTFPKGHIEKGETPPAAALREVLEETGWLCRIIKPLFLARYFFRWRGSLIKKSVRWFLMTPVRKAGIPDAMEILETRWMSVSQAQRLTRYPSDKKLLRLLNVS